MTTKSNKFTPKLKFYHIVLISIILCPFLILNSNSVNKKREEAKLEKENIIVLRKLYARKLDEKFKEDTNKVCEKASQDLRDYYSGKGDLKSLGIDENKDVKRENQGEYIDGLINTVSGEGEGNLMDYIIHLIPVLVFLAIGILLLPGWLVCCICSCADCCCCCCCKKDSCKLPFYIVSSVFYVFGLGVSIYGFSQTKAVFEGIGDTECSLLKFIDDVLNGEGGERTPRWAGIDNIKEILVDAQARISNIDANIENTLDGKKGEVKGAQNSFESDLQKYSRYIYLDDDDGISGETNYKHTLSFTDDSSKNGDYVLDIVYKFGKFSKTTSGDEVTITKTPNSFVEGWYEEYKLISQETDQQMGTVSDNFGTITSKKAEAENALESGRDKINDLKKSFDKVKDKISKVLINYSDSIDEYGSIGYKAVFSVFMVIDVLIAAFISFRMFCKFPTSLNGCLNCLLKSAIHILWNILALMTFFTLILGSILSIVGTLGNDLISVVSFLVSDENLLKSNNDVILLGDAAEYLVKCINGDGDLKNELNLNYESLKNLDNLTSASYTIDNLIQQTESLKEFKNAYNNYKSKFERVKSYEIDDLNLIKTDGSNTITFNDYISKANQDLKDVFNENWSISCNNNALHNCEGPVTSVHSSDFYCIEIPTCTTKSIKNWHSSLTENMDVINAFIENINTAKKEITTTNADTKSIKYALDTLNQKYEDYIDKQSEILQYFKDKIDELAGIFIRFTGANGGFFQLVNCKFIGINIRIILKTLDKSLGTNIYNVGVTMIATGLGMCFSISFTILLNIILNQNGISKPDIGDGDPNVNIVNQYDMNQPNMNFNNGNGFNTNGNFNEGLRTIDYNNGM